MSQFYEYNWPVAVVDGISLSQTTTANTPLLLNGSYAKNNVVRFLDDYGIVPKITLKSTADLSTIEFRIIGYQNGIFISETLTGPNNTTVTSTNYFDIVEQIIPAGATASTVQAGVASVGYFPIIILNAAKQNVSSINYALNMITTQDNPATYKIYLSLENNLRVGMYNDLITNGTFVKWNENTISQLIQSSDLGQNLLIEINQNNNSSTLTAQFLQL